MVFRTWLAAAAAFLGLCTAAASRAEDAVLTGALAGVLVAYVLTWAAAEILVANKRVRAVTYTGIIFAALLLLTGFASWFFGWGGVFWPVALLPSGVVLAIWSTAYTA